MDKEVFTPGLLWNNNCKPFPSLSPNSVLNIKVASLQFLWPRSPLWDYVKRRIVNTNSSCNGSWPWGPVSNSWEVCGK